jgi:hypothetical protein
VLSAVVFRLPCAFLPLFSFSFLFCNFDVSGVQLLESSCCEPEGEMPAKRVRAERHYGCYSKIRHNSRTYKIELLDIDNSDASK